MYAIYGQIGDDGGGTRLFTNDATLQYMYIYKLTRVLYFPLLLRIDDLAGALLALLVASLGSGLRTFGCATVLGGFS